MEEVQKKLDDHEERLRSLERDRLETKYTLLSIDKNQSELKAMQSENSKYLTQLLNKFVDSELNVRKETRRNTWELVFKVWAVTGPVITAIAAYLIGKG